MSSLQVLILDSTLPFSPRQCQDHYGFGEAHPSTLSPSRLACKKVGPYREYLPWHTHKVADLLLFWEM